MISFCVLIRVFLLLTISHDTKEEQVTLSVLILRCLSLSKQNVHMKLELALDEDSIFYKLGSSGLITFSDYIFLLTVLSSKSCIFFPFACRSKFYNQYITVCQWFANFTLPRSPHYPTSFLQINWHPLEQSVIQMQNCEYKHLLVLLYTSRNQSNNNEIAIYISFLVRNYKWMTFMWKNSMILSIPLLYVVFLASHVGLINFKNIQALSDHRVITSTTYTAFGSF